MRLSILAVSIILAKAISAQDAHKKPTILDIGLKNMLVSNDNNEVKSVSFSVTPGDIICKASEDELKSDDTHFCDRSTPGWSFVIKARPENVEHYNFAIYKTVDEIESVQNITDFFLACQKTGDPSGHTYSCRQPATIDLTLIPPTK